MNKPLKRRPELQPLSSEHHNGLLLALRVRTSLAGRPAAGAPAELNALVDLVARDYEVTLLPHFRAEEEVLLAVETQRVDVADPFVVRVLTDHVALHGHVWAACREGRSDDERRIALGTFATRLDAHIRFEERQWFERLQDTLPEAEWAYLGAALRARASGASCALRAAKPTAP